MTHLPEQKFPESLVVETREEIAQVIPDPTIRANYIEHKVFHLLKNKLDLELYVEELVNLKANPSPYETERQREVAALHLDFIRRWLAQVIRAIAPLDSDDPMDFGRVGNVLGAQSELMKLPGSEDKATLTFIERGVYDAVVEINYQSYGASLGRISEKVAIEGDVIDSVMMKSVNKHVVKLLEKGFIARSVSKDGVGSVTYSPLNNKIDFYSTIGASQGLNLDAWMKLWAIPFEAIPAE